MKKYLPIENITYTTKLDSEQILIRIGEVVEPKKTFRMAGIFLGIVPINPIKEVSMETHLK